MNTYKGFYVARYEASLPKEMIGDMSINTFADNNSENKIKDASNNYYKPESKLGGIVWNRVSYNSAREVSKAFIETDEVKSGIIPGKYWDTMLQFIAQTGVNINSSTDWGNYYNKKDYTIIGYYRTRHANGTYKYGTYTKLSNGFLLLQTGMFGYSNDIHPKNLYDVAGNVWEWSGEKVTTVGGVNTLIGNPVHRGGYNDNGNELPVSYRAGSNGVDSTYPHIVFRIVLYIL